MTHRIVLVVGLFATIILPCRAQSTSSPPPNPPLISNDPNLDDYGIISTNPSVPAPRIDMPMTPPFSINFKRIPLLGELQPFQHVPINSRLLSNTPSTSSKQIDAPWDDPNLAYPPNSK